MEEPSDRIVRVARKVFLAVFFVPLGLILGSLIWYLLYHRGTIELALLAAALFCTPLLKTNFRKSYGLGYIGLLLLAAPFGFYQAHNWYINSIPMPGITWGPSRAPITVAGIYPGYGADRSVEKALSSLGSEPHIEYESRYIPLPQACGSARFALSDGRVVDSRIDIIGDLNLTRPWSERETFPKDGSFVGISWTEALANMQSLYDVDLEPVEGVAWECSPLDLMIYRDIELAVFGTRLVQNTSPYGELNGKVLPHLEARLNYSYNSRKDRFFDDFRAQGRVYVREADTRIVRIWAVYELPERAENQ